ncbi:MAG: hypothetical protein ACTHK6_06095 [Solirubrobacterales bacterium]
MLTPGASGAERAKVIGPPEVQAMVETFLVPTLPRPVRVKAMPCPGDPTAQGCHSSGRQMDTIWLNPAAGGLDTETLAHEMGHVFESYLWDLRWREAPNSSFVPRDLYRIATVLFEDPAPGILYSTAWSERFAESYSACARFPELTETLVTGYWGFEMTPEQHDQICPAIDRLAQEYEEATTPAPLVLKARPLAHRHRPRP